MDDILITETNVGAEMREIYNIHLESGNEAHSKAGFIIKKAIEDSLHSKKTHYTTKFVNGKRIIVKNSSAHNMGERFSRVSGKKLDVDMGGFIQWRTYASTGTTVIGGLFKAGLTEIRRNGKIVKTTKVYGVAQDAVDILEKISSGKTNKAKWKDYKTGSLTTKSIDRFDGTHKGNHFIEEGKNRGISTIKSKLEKWYDDAVENRDRDRREKESRRI